MLSRLSSGISDGNAGGADYCEGERWMMMIRLMVARALETGSPQEALNMKTWDGTSLNQHHVSPRARSGSCEKNSRLHVRLVLLTAGNPFPPISMLLGLECSWRCEKNSRFRIAIVCEHNFPTLRFEGAVARPGPRFRPNMIDIKACAIQCFEIRSFHSMRKHQPWQHQPTIAFLEEQLAVCV